MLQDVSKHSLSLTAVFQRLERLYERADTRDKHLLHVQLKHQPYEATHPSMVSWWHQLANKAATYHLNLQYQAELDIYVITGKPSDVIAFLKGRDVFSANILIRQQITDMHFIVPDTGHLHIVIKPSGNITDSTIYTYQEQTSSGSSALVMLSYEQLGLGKFNNQDSFQLGSIISAAIDKGNLVFNNTISDGNYQVSDINAFHKPIFVPQFPDVSFPLPIGNVPSVGNGPFDPLMPEPGGNPITPPSPVLPGIDVPSSLPTGSITAVSATFSALTDNLNGTAINDIYLVNQVSDWSNLDTIHAGQGYDRVIIQNGTLNLSLGNGGYNLVNSIEAIEFENDASHQLIIDDSYFTQGGGLDATSLTVSALANATNGITVNAAGLVAPHAVQVNGGQGTDNLVGGAGNDNFAIAWQTVSSPSSISSTNLKHWLDGSDRSTLTENGGLIEQWRDKSGNNYHLNQSVNGLKPRIATDSYGRETVLFDGGDELYANGPNISGEITVFAVSRTNTTGLGTRIMWSNGISGDGTRQYFVTEINRVAGGKQSNIWGDIIINSGTATVNSTDPYIYTQSRSGSTGNWQLDFFLNGGADGSVATAINPNGADTVGVGVLYSENVFHWNGTISEIIVYDKALSTTETDAITLYLANKYGIAPDAAVSNTNDTVEGGAGYDTLKITSGTFVLTPGSNSSVKSIESFDLRSNHAAHEIFLTDDYYNNHQGITNDVVMVNASGNLVAIRVEASSLSAPHRINVEGSNAGDRIYGGAGNDTISTANGQDSVAGGGGNDMLTGGSGNDRWVYQSGSGQDTITDFEQAGSSVGDVIQLELNLNTSGIIDWASLQPHISQSGTSAVIDLEPGNPGTHTITLLNTNSLALTTDDFSFV